jgi:hypothetical protein
LSGLPLSQKGKLAYDSAGGFMGTAIGVLAAGLVVAVAAYFVMRGDEEVVATPTPVATIAPSSTATVQPTVQGTAPPTGTAAPRPSATPPPSPTLAAGRRAVPAPIQSVKVEAGSGTPRQYTVTIAASLPNGCVMKYTQDVKREGDTFVITVLNSEPTAPVRCTSVVTPYEVKVTIVEALVAGRTYTVKANDKTTTFRAQ